MTAHCEICEEILTRLIKKAVDNTEDIKQLTTDELAKFVDTEIDKFVDTIINIYEREQNG